MTTKGVGHLKSASRLNERTRYTDLHCHILPGFDDGAQDWDEALAMARNAVTSGAFRVVATPHVMRGAYWHSPDDIGAKTSERRTRLSDVGIAIDAIPGSEVYLSANTAREYRSGRLLTIGNSGYLLVELPSRYLPSCSLRLINLGECLTRGMFPHLYGGRKQRGHHPVDDGRGMRAIFVKTGSAYSP